MPNLTANALSGPVAGDDRGRMGWATSKTVGGVSEIAVLSPIRLGCPPGERRTYEQRARAAIGSLASRHQRGLPVELNRLATIHFGRIILLRPEQYLVNSKAEPVVDYEPPDPERWGDEAPDRIPRALDEYQEGAKPNGAPRFRSWLLTLVEFDGDLKVYMRDIAQFLAGDFDKIFENCDHFPGTARFEPFWHWIRRYQIPTDLFYATYPNLSVTRIKQLEAFKRQFDAFVARVRSPTGERVGSMDELFDEFLRQTQQYAGDFPSPGGLYGAGNPDKGG